MTAYEIVADSIERDEWLIARRSLLGASDVPSVLRIPGAFGSPLSVAADKLSDEPPEPMKEHQEAGLRLEQTIGEWAAECIAKGEGLDLLGVYRYGLLLRSTAYPWLGCTPDMRIDFAGRVGAPLQCKNTIYDWERENEIPPRVVAQVLTELIVLDEPNGYVATLMMGNRLRWARIDRADYREMEETILTETERFWNALQNGERIEPDGHHATRKAIERLYPAQPDKAIALPGRFVEIDRLRQEFLERAKIEQEQADRLGNEIRAAMGEAEIAHLPNGVRYTYKQGASSRPLLRKEGA